MELVLAMRVAAPPDYHAVMAGLSATRLRALLGSDAAEPWGAYLHWDKLRHLEPPAELSHEEWWLLIKLGRHRVLRPTQLRDPDGEPFVYCKPDLVLRRLHNVDQRCSGAIAMPAVVTADDQAQRHYLVNSLMEEAIRSSQLEGATTSRKEAKELLRSGRAPEDRSERMILNNYRGLEFLREMDGPLTPTVVLELHRVLTEGTLDDPSASGRLQDPSDDRVAVLDRHDGHLVHKPPPAEQLPDRLAALCNFANEPVDSEEFVHPVIRAILLHFWLAYDHPFEDGNGRTARALFYWYMRSHGYWLVEYLSISRILANAPSKYSKAFVLTETDERDLTYFILYQLEVIQRAVDELYAYLGRKVDEVREVEKLLRARVSDFNHRQLALLSHALRTPNQIYTLQSHSASHGVTHETARNDLLPLTERGLLIRTRMGRRHAFSPAEDLPEQLRER
ncbi:MAG: Fic family protein [Thermoleophilaceae bacterium]